MQALIIQREAQKTPGTRHAARKGAAVHVSQRIPWVSLKACILAYAERAQPQTAAKLHKGVSQLHTEGEVSCVTQLHC